MHKNSGTTPFFESYKMESNTLLQSNRNAFRANTTVQNSMQILKVAIELTKHLISYSRVAQRLAGFRGGITHC